MDAFARQRAQEYREGGDECLTFACRHFGNLALVEYDAADELHVVVHHVPCHVVAAGGPVVFPDCFVAFYGDEFASFAGKIAVELCGCDNDGLILCESCCRLAYSGEHHWQMLVELVFDDFENLLFVCVDFVPQRLALVERQFFDFVAYFFDCFVVGFCGSCDIGAHVGDFLAQGVVVELLHDGNLFLDFGKDGLYGFQVACGFIAEYSFENRCE
mgnify:CR=1 FL=1